MNSYSVNDIGNYIYGVVDVLIFPLIWFFVAVCLMSSWFIYKNIKNGDAKYNAIKAAYEARFHEGNSNESVIEVSYDEFLKLPRLMKLESDEESSLSHALTKLPPLFNDKNIIDTISHISADLKPHILYKGSELSGAVAVLGFSNIELVARAIISFFNEKSTSFFGINRGGYLLATLLTERIGVDQKHLIKCDYKPEWERVAYCEPRNEDPALIIVIDDCVRTGRTLTKVKEYIHEHYPDSKVYTIALVVSAFEDENSISRNERLCRLVDYYPWISLNNKTSLPWSNESDEGAKKYIKDQDKEIDQLVGTFISNDVSNSADDKCEHKKLKKTEAA